VYTRLLKSDENQAQGNTARRSDFTSNTLTSLDTFKAAFDNVMKLLPKGYPFGKGGYTNLTKTLTDKAIDDFSTLKKFHDFRP